MTHVRETNTRERDVSKHECRACLQTIETVGLFNLFQPWSSDWKGMEYTIAEDLAKVANIQISEADRHSKFICNSCCVKLQDACQFVCLVRENDRLLRLRFPPCDDNENNGERTWPKPIQIDKNIPYNNDLEVDIKQEVLSEEEYNYNVEDGYREAEYINHLEIKVEPEEIVEVKPSQIIINGARSLHEVSIDSKTLENGPIHDEEFLGTKIKEEPVSDAEDVEPAPGEMPLECMLCTKNFNSVSGLKAHVISQHSYKTVKRKAGDRSPQKQQKARYTCATCKRTFSTPTDLMVHESCHSEHACFGCHARFDSFALLTAHADGCKALAQQVKVVKTLDDVIRPLPEELPSNKKSKSAKSNSANESFVCDLCKEEFSDSYYMNIHKEIHHCKESAGLTVDGGPIPMEIEALESIFNEDT